MSDKETRLGGDPFRHEAGVPRRFGVGTLFVFSTMYAVLFGICRLIGIPPAVLAWISLFVFAIGLGQMLLFKGRRPRRASVIVGACAFPCMSAGAMAYVLLAQGVRPAEMVDDVFYGLVCSLPAGMVLGYVAGLLIAGHFLVIDAIRNLRVRSTDIDRND